MSHQNGTFGGRGPSATDPDAQHKSPIRRSFPSMAVVALPLAMLLVSALGLGLGRGDMEGREAGITSRSFFFSAGSPPPEASGGTQRSTTVEGEEAATADPQLDSEWCDEGAWGPHPQTLAPREHVNVREHVHPNALEAETSSDVEAGGFVPAPSFSGVRFAIPFLSHRSNARRALEATTQRQAAALPRCPSPTSPLSKHFSSEAAGYENPAMPRRAPGTGARLPRVALLPSHDSDSSPSQHIQYIYCRPSADSSKNSSRSGARGGHSSTHYSSGSGWVAYGGTMPQSLAASGVGALESAEPSAAAAAFEGVGVERATLCADRSHPLRVALIVASPAAVRAQLAALTGGALINNGDVASPPFSPLARSVRQSPHSFIVPGHAAVRETIVAIVSRSPATAGAGGKAGEHDTTTQRLGTSSAPNPRLFNYTVAILSYATLPSPFPDPNAASFGGPRPRGTASERALREYALWVGPKAPRALRLVLPPTDVAAAEVAAVLLDEGAGRAGMVVEEAEAEVGGVGNQKERRHLISAVIAAAMAAETQRDLVREQAANEKDNRASADADEAAGNEVLLRLEAAAARGLRQFATAAPHFVYEVPRGAAFTVASLGALCRYEPTLNDESEAVAVYPYASPLRHGGADRLPLGFVFAPPPPPPHASANAAVRHPQSAASDNSLGCADADDDALSASTAAVTPPLITFVSSCRRPSTVARADAVVDVRHYSKGGDVALRGAARMVRTFAGPFVPFEGGVFGGSVLPSIGGAEGMEGGTEAKIGGNGPSEAVDQQQERREGQHTYRGVFFANLHRPLPLAHREAIFPMRRPPLGARCSADPDADPTRLLSVYPFYVDLHRIAMPHNDHRIFARCLNATAMLGALSDVVIAANVPARLVMGVVRSASRGVSFSAFAAAGVPPGGRSQGSASLMGLSAGGRGGECLAGLPRLLPADPSIPFDAAYPNAAASGGELVIVDFSVANRHHIVAGLAQHVEVAAKGFYDFVRYSEEDAFITRDQFALFCAAVGRLEAAGRFLNFLRFEYDPRTPSIAAAVAERADTERTRAGMVRGSRRQSLHSGFSGEKQQSVLRAFAPDQYWFTDEATLPHKWQFSGPPEGLLIQPAARVAVHNKERGDAPEADMRVVGVGAAHMYAVSNVSVGECSRPPFFNASLFPPTPSTVDAILGYSTINGELVHPLFPPAQASVHSYATVQRKAMAMSSNTSGRSKDVGGTGDTAGIAGCFIVASLQHTFYRDARVYNAMHLVPDTRLAYFFADEVSVCARGGRVEAPRYAQWGGFGSMDREFAAFFRSPLATYSAGVALLRPYPLTAAVPNITGSKRFVMDRLSLIGHGSNRHVVKGRARVAFPIFEF